MWMVANVIETDAPAYQVGQPVDVTVPAYPDKVFKGRVTAIGSTIDPNTRRQLVRSEVEDPDHLLRSGMYASFVIRVGRIVAFAGSAGERRGAGRRWHHDGVGDEDGHRFTRRTGGYRASAERLGADPGWLAVRRAVVTDGAVFLSNMLLSGADRLIAVDGHVKRMGQV